MLRLHSRLGRRFDRGFVVVCRLHPKLVYVIERKPPPAFAS
jgi:hypothetical protein